MQLLTNQTLLATRPMQARNTGSPGFEQGEEQTTSGGSAASAQKGLARRILAACHHSNAPDSMPCGECAFRRLIPSGPSGQEKREAEESTKAGPLPRGGLRSLVGNRLAHSSANGPFRTSTPYSATVTVYYEDALHRLLSPHSLVDRDKCHDLPPYRDTAPRVPTMLRTPPARLGSERVALLHSERVASGSFFTEAKKYAE